MTEPLYFIPADPDDHYEEADKYGNPISGDSQPYCCNPDCGCPENRLCMASNGFGSKCCDDLIPIYLT